MSCSLKGLVCRTDAELGTLDVAQINLACVVGLPNTPPIDTVALCKKLDEWANEVRKTTKRFYSIYEAGPAEFAHSKNRFRVGAMVEVLQRILGIRYDSTLIHRDDFFQDPGNLFLHGVIANRRGTCTSLPALFLAVGRRLGYPLKLVSTKSHFFARWDDGRERFNVECTSLGFVSHSDEHYLSWPAPTTLDEVREFAFLRSKTPRGELAAFLASRGHCFLDNLMHREAADAYGWAFEMEPACALHAGSMDAALNRWQRSLQTRYSGVTPPSARVAYDRRFEQLPIDLERRFVALSHVQDWLETTYPDGVRPMEPEEDARDFTNWYKPHPKQAAAGIEFVRNPAELEKPLPTEFTYRFEDRVPDKVELVETESNSDEPIYLDDNT